MPRIARDQQGRFVRAQPLRLNVTEVDNTTGNIIYQVEETGERRAYRDDCNCRPCVQFRTENDLDANPSEIISPHETYDAIARLRDRLTAVEPSIRRRREPPPPPPKPWEGKSESEYYMDRFGDYPEIQYYSYRPRMEFKGEGPLFLGLELEITTDNAEHVPGVYDDNLVPMRIVTRKLDGIAYMKSDSSIDGGFEIVTHPMSYDFFMNEFPWDTLPTLEQYGVRTVSRNNGIHVHVSREGFDGAAHSYRWIKLWYRNPRQVEQLAGRRAGHWSNFDPSSRQAQFYHLKNRQAMNHGYYPNPEDEMRERAGYQRYNIINTMNADTFEVRAFAATLDPELAKSRVQLVASSIEYTRRLSARQIAREQGWDWDRYAKFVKQDARYPELAARI